MVRLVTLIASFSFRPVVHEDRVLPRPGAHAEGTAVCRRTGGGLILFIGLELAAFKKFRPMTRAPASLKVPRCESLPSGVGDEARGRHMAAGPCFCFTRLYTCRLYAGRRRAVRLGIVPHRHGGNAGSPSSPPCRHPYRLRDLPVRQRSSRRADLASTLILNPLDRRPPSE